MVRLSAGLLLTAILLAGAPSIRLAEEGGQAVWIADGCAPDSFAVYVDSLSGAPPLAGSLSERDGAVVFAPRFPPSPGLRYRAECSAHKAFFDIPAPERSATTVVEQVFPSADTLPENLLKFYLHFSAPMSKGFAYDKVRLLDGSGQEVELPFLEIDEELWDADYRRLTLLFDPGRIKTGLVPNQEVGIALRPGRRYTLAIDEGWEDAERNPLKASFKKQFSVVEADTTPPSPRNWTVTSPEGANEPVIVDFPEPLDEALLRRVVSVVTSTGSAVRGTVEISRGETRWAFTPDQPWATGRYRIEAQTILEDLAGNSIERPFEVDVFEKVEDQIFQKTASIPFRVGRD